MREALTLPAMPSRAKERDREGRNTSMKPNANKADTSPEKEVRKTRDEEERGRERGHSFECAMMALAKHVATDLPNNPERMRPVFLRDTQG